MNLKLFKKVKISYLESLDLMELGFFIILGKFPFRRSYFCCKVVISRKLLFLVNLLFWESYGFGLLGSYISHCYVSNAKKIQIEFQSSLGFALVIFYGFRMSISSRRPRSSPFKPSTPSATSYRFSITYLKFWYECDNHPLEL